MPDVLKFVHILFATFWVGGAVLLAGYGASLVKADTAAKIAFSRMTIVAVRMFAGLAAVALAAGTWLVLEVDHFAFDQAWISIGFVGIILGAVLGPAFYAPQARALIGELESGDAGASARQKRIARVSVLEALLLIAVVWAMVYQPGGVV